MVGASSVIVYDVKEFELVIGNPGRHIGWVGKADFRLNYKSDKLWICPKTGALNTVNESI
jgi:UDP-2-acetamido-3-amino-2,3-dideoxy-glucuronate N-acetyltransferase